MIVYETPERLRTQAISYPGHHFGPNIEEAFTQYAYAHKGDIKTDWTFLPIHWQTVYFENRKRHKTADFEADKEAQRIINDIATSPETFFTVSQADEVTYERRPKNLKVFGCGGGDYAIPLLTSPLPYTHRDRTILASFIGQIETGGPQEGVQGKSSWNPDGSGARVRRAMQTALRYEPNILVKDQNEQRDPLKMEEFRETLCRSVFALCPRGYGRTSFRMYEAMGLGAIPVYIYDDPWLPYQDVLDWREFAVLIHERMLSGLAHYLRNTAADVKAKQTRLAEVVPDYFTMDGACRQIHRMIEEYSK